MATEALDLPRNPTFGLRLPYHIRVLLRASRIARSRRALRLIRQLGNADDRVLADVGASRYHDARYDWLAEMMKPQGRGG